MTVCEHGCDITRLLNGYVFSNARFDWLVGNMNAYQENFDQEVKKQHVPSFVELF